jgi:uncharacterized membrane protein YeaQ/YmgE (transglycosylase-associated protein family)
MSLIIKKEKIITAAIIMGLFGGLVGGPVFSIVFYYAQPEKRFWLFIIPEFIGFCCLGLMLIYRGKPRTR